jgi:hypothetical protein
MRVHLDAVQDGTQSVVENRIVDVFPDSGHGQQGPSAPNTARDAEAPRPANSGRRRATGARPRA